MSSIGFDGPKIGFLEPGGGGGGVSTVNSVAPDGGGNVALAAADIPFDDTVLGSGSTDMQLATDYTGTHFGPLQIIRSAADLPAAVAGSHRIDTEKRHTGTVFLAPGDFLTFAAGGSWKGVNTIGSIIVGNRAGPLIEMEPDIGRLELADMSIVNLHPAGSGFSLVGEAPGGIPTAIVVIRAVTFQAATSGTLANILFGKAENMSTASWTDGITLTGVIGAIALNGASIIDPANVVAPGYRAMRTNSGTFISVATIRWDYDGISGGARGIYLDPTSTYLTSSGIRLLDCTGRPDNYLDPAGLGAADADVFVSSGTPDTPSTVYAGAAFEDTIDFIAVPILVEGTPVEIPGRSVGAVDLAPLSLESRAELTVDGAPSTTWRITSTAAEAVEVRVVIDVRVEKPSGPDFTSQIFASNQGVEIPGSRLTVLCTATTLAFDIISEPFPWLANEELTVSMVNPVGNGVLDPSLFQFDFHVEKLP